LPCSLKCLISNFVGGIIVFVPFQTIPQQVFDRVASEQDRKGLSWTKDDREVRAIIDEERKLAAIRESKLMSSDPSLFSP